MGCGGILGERPNLRHLNLAGGEREALSLIVIAAAGLRDWGGRAECCLWPERRLLRRLCLSSRPP